MIQIRFQLILRVVAAFLLAIGSARFIYHFQLLEFTLAPQLSFTFIFIGIILLSRQYEPTLHALLAAFSLVVFIKSFGLKPRAEEPAGRDAVLNRLFITAALLKSDKIKKGGYPGTLKDLKFAISGNDQLDYCAGDCPWKTPAVQSSSGGFWLRSLPKNSRDKDILVWYINAAFEVYFRKASETDFRKIMEDSKGTPL